MIIGAIIPDRRDSTSVYRGVGPLSALRRDYGHQTVHLRSIEWSTLREIDVLFMQRPCLPEHLQAIRAAHASNVPVWVDFDDDLASIPEWNPTTMLYNAKKYGANTLEAAAMADLLTVSTRRLLEVYKPLDGVAVVVPNAIDTQWLPPNPRPRDPAKKIVLWRGSGTHRWDLNLLWPAVQEIESRRDDVRFVFMSDNPPWFVEYMRTDAEFIPWMDYPSYMRALNEVAPDVVVVPLYDCPLNRAKSNIAAQPTFRFSDAWQAAEVRDSLGIFRSKTDFKVRHMPFLKLLVSAIEQEIDGRIDTRIDSESSRNHQCHRCKAVSNAPAGTHHMGHQKLHVSGRSDSV